MIVDSKEALAALGEKLKKYREEIGLSQRQLAAKCTVEQSDISRIERGLLNPGFLLLVDISRGLGVTPSDLLSGIN